MRSLSSGSILGFYLTWGFIALGGAGTLPITWTRLVNEHFQRNKGLALGLAMMGSGLFGIFAKPYVRWLIEQWLAEAPEIVNEVRVHCVGVLSKSDQALIERTLAEHGREGFLAGWLPARGAAWAADLIPDLNTGESS